MTRLEGFVHRCIEACLTYAISVHLFRGRDDTIPQELKTHSSKQVCFEGVVSFELSVAKLPG